MNSCLEAEHSPIFVNGPIIVGAGPSGLSVAACLSNRGVPSVILERTDCLASLWQKRTYDRLKLHLPKHFCELPLMKFPKNFPRYPSKQQFISYIESYAARFNIKPVFNQTVEKAGFDVVSCLWKVKTQDAVYTSKWLVVATGENAEPVVPDIPGLKNFTGPVVHTSAYKSGSEFANRKVLVVGCGNSGMEVCLDLCRYNALPHMVVRNPLHVLPRDFFGLSSFGIAMTLLKWFPLKLVDNFLLLLANSYLGNTDRLGLRRPKTGPIELKNATGKTPVLDVGAISLIQSGQIRVRHAVKELTKKGAKFVDGQEMEFESIILATGYKSNVPDWLKENSFFTKEGMPKTPFPNGWKGENGLYTVGFTKRGLLGTAFDAVKIAENITGASNSPSMASEDSLSSNPLLQNFNFPPFDVVDARHVRPGIRALLHQLEAELDQLEKTVEPSWPKLVEPLEKIVDRLSVVWGIINHLKAVKDTPELRAAIEEVQPEKVKFQLRLGQSKPIYSAFKSIRESSDWNTLSEARQRLVEAQIKEAVLSGIALEDDKREEFNKIEQELEKLSHKFSENVLDATKKFEKLITDKKEIEGLPPSALGLFAQAAVSKGNENATADTGPWLITLDAPSYLPVMQHAKNRALREEVYRAYLSRASSGDLDNTAIIDQILKLRLEKSKLLGYSNYAEVSMATKMATVEKADELLEKLRSASWAPAVQDIEDLKSFAKNQGAAEADSLTHWDVTFWSERLRESKYDINEEELRPYFSLPKVMDGLFRLAKTLFGVDVVPADGVAPVWNSDVRFYCVKDSSGTPTAYFYFDPYSRPSEKRGGAWMDEVFSRSRVMAQKGSSVRLPVAQMVCNQTPPVGDKPSLMTFREVETVFHEFGHALQHMLTKEDEGLVSGIRNIEWDAVELPSQFMENWCYHRDTLMSIAKHYQTGETLPEDVYKKLLAARTFRAGSLSLRQLKFATVDLELHTKYVPGGTESIYDVDQRVSIKTQVIPPLPEDRFLCSFSHIFAGGYAAGYYSYKWAEVLSADAFSAFEDAGLDDIKAVKETGQRFRNTILALGGGKAPLQVFVAFRGREPSPEPLLRHNGLLAASA